MRTRVSFAHVGLALLLAALGCRPEAEPVETLAEPVAGAEPAEAVVAPADPAPNVLLVTIDTLRADRLGVYGYPYPTSPNIDRFAERAVVFERGIAASAHTSPSHASILTSRYTREHSIGHQTGQTRLEGAPTLADHFREAGYATAGFVGNANLRRRSGFARGFDVYDDELPDKEANRDVFERIADQTNDRALSWLDEQEGPFFLWVHYQDPHGPYTPPEGFEGRIAVTGADAEPELPINPTSSGARGIPNYQAREGHTRPSEYEGLYAEEILYADSAFGKLIERVETHSPDRKTIVLLTADHGEAMGEDEIYFAHSYTTRPQLAHVPFILRAPGLAAGRTNFVVSHVDVLPTLLELTGLAPAKQVSGRALGPIVRGEEPEPERMVFCDIGHELTAYHGDSMIEVQRVKDAWDPDGTKLDPAFMSQWYAFAWQPGAPPRPAKLDDELKAPIRDYFRKTVPMIAAPPHTDEEIEALRALGYIDDPVDDREGAGESANK